MVSQPFSYGFPMVALWFPLVFLQLPCHDTRFACALGAGKAIAPGVQRWHFLWDMTHLQNWGGSPRNLGNYPLVMTSIHPDVEVSAYVETRWKLHGTLCIQEVKQVSASMSTTQWDALCRSVILRSMKVPFSSAKFSEFPSGRVCTVMSKQEKIYIYVC